MSGTGTAAASASAPARNAPLDESGAREFLRITRSMIAAAHADDWSAVTRHDHARRELLDAAPAGTGGGLPDALVEALIAADRVILERARRVRDALVEDTHRARAERDARDTYSRVMGGERDGVRA